MSIRSVSSHSTTTVKYDKHYLGLVNIADDQVHCHPTSALRIVIALFSFFPCP